LSASYLLRANANRLNKNSKAAVKDYTYVIKLDPGNKDAYWNRAAAYNILQDFKLSAVDYTRTMSFFQNDKPRLATLYDSRAINEFMQNLFDEAIKDDSVAIALNPDVEQEYTDQAIAYNKNGNYQAAIKLYHVALGFQGNNNRQNSFLYTLIGINLYALNEYEDAISSCTKAILLDPENAQAYFRRGEFFLNKMNNKQQAMADFNKVIELDTTKKTHYFLFSLFYTGNSNWAISTFETYLLNADNVVAERNVYYDLACLYAMMNKTQDANHYLKIAINKGYSKKCAMADEYLDNIRNTNDYKSAISK
jgi:tetratricopeptide (TPR) repeat protein